MTKTPEGWLLKPVSPGCHVYLQLPKEEDSEPVCVPSGGEVLVGGSIICFISSFFSLTALLFIILDHGMAIGDA